MAIAVDFPYVFAKQTDNRSLEKKRDNNWRPRQIYWFNRIFLKRFFLYFNLQEENYFKD